MTTMKTNYQDLFKGCTIVYSDKKNTARMERIRVKYQENKRGKKFLPLKSSEDFDGYKEDFTAYRQAVDTYMKTLYQSEKTPTKDKALTQVLCCLSATASQIEELKKANVHNTLTKMVMRDRQTLTQAARDQIAAYKREAELIISEGKKFDPEGNLIVLSETARNEELEKIDNAISEIKLGANYEASEFTQVSLGTFTKALEKFIGAWMESDTLVKEYLTLDKKELNRKWTKLMNKAEEAKISVEEFEIFHKKNDADGLRVLIEEKKAELEAAEKEAMEDQTA